MTSLGFEPFDLKLFRYPTEKLHQRKSAWYKTMELILRLQESVFMCHQVVGHKVGANSCYDIMYGIPDLPKMLDHCIECKMFYDRAHVS